MSYDVFLQEQETGNTIELTHPYSFQGGTYLQGYRKGAWISVTGNYSETIDEIMSLSSGSNVGLRKLDGYTGKESIHTLLYVLTALTEHVDYSVPTNNYWEVTPANIAKTLVALIHFATMRPDGIFKVVG